MEKVRQSAIWIKHEAMLILTIEFAVEKFLDDICGFGEWYAVAAQCGNLTLKHRVKRFDRQAV